MVDFVHKNRGPAQCPANVDPDAILDFGVEWKDFFGDGIAIVSADWDVGTLTKEQEGIAASYPLNGRTYSNIALVRLSGFQDGQDHLVRCRATAANGQRDDRSMILHAQHQ